MRQLLGSFRQCLQPELQSNLLDSLLQAMLITKHVLFLGFSLSDANFHKIVHSVYRTMGSRAKDHATALMLPENMMMQELWNDRMHLVGMLPEVHGKPFDFAAAARLQDVFLDLLTYYSAVDVQSSSRFILDPKYANLLSEVDKCAKDHVLRMFAEFPRESKESVIYNQLDELLHRMGAS